MTNIDKNALFKSTFFLYPNFASASKQDKGLLTFAKVPNLYFDACWYTMLSFMLRQTFQVLLSGFTWPRKAFVLSLCNYSLFLWQNNNSHSKDHNTDEFSDLTHFTVNASPPFPHCTLCLFFTAFVLCCWFFFFEPHHVCTASV